MLISSVNSNAICSTHLPSISLANMAKRRDLTDEEKGDAARALALFEKKKAVDPTFTQAMMAADLGWETQGAVSQYLTGRTKIGMEVAIKLAKYFGVSLMEISPRFAAMIEGVPVKPKGAPEGTTIKVEIKETQKKRAPIVEEKVHKFDKAKNLKIKSARFRG